MNDHHDHDHAEHSHEHGLGHDHHHIPTTGGEKNLFFSIFLNIIIVVAEIAGGIISGSLALLSDAFHNLSDVFSMIISYIAIQISKRSKNTVKTYGYKRSEILAALFNVLTLFAVCGYILYEAIKRLSSGAAVINQDLMLLIAIIGLAGNGISVALLFKEAKSNINIKSAFLHLLGDTVSSVAVIATAIVLKFWNLYFLDSVISILIVLYILKESFSILMESVNILMQAAPKGIDKHKLKEAILAIKEFKIKDVHHIHMWDLAPGSTVFDAHVVVDKADLTNADRIIQSVNTVLSKEYKICHSTIQLESEGFNHCVSCEL